MPFRHVVLLRFVLEATDEQRAAVLDGLRGLPAQIPELQSYVFGTDAGLTTPAANHDLGIVADFASVDDYVVYRDHPDHVAVIQERILPILADRAAIQYEH